MRLIARMVRVGVVSRPPGRVSRRGWYGRPWPGLPPDPWPCGSPVRSPTRSSRTSFRQL